MTHRFAQALSYILHPAVIPTLGSALVMLTSPIYIPLTVFYYTLGFVFISTYLLPGSFSVLLKYVGVIESLHMKSPRDRRYPFLVSIAFFLFAANTLTDWPIPGEIAHLLLASAITLILFYLFLGKTKLSVHLAGMGGLTAVTIYSSWAYEVELLAVIALAIALSGLLGSARLKLKAHTPFQVYAGYSIGFTITWLTLLLLRGGWGLIQ